MTLRLRNIVRASLCGLLLAGTPVFGEPNQQPEPDAEQAHSALDGLGLAHDARLNFVETTFNKLLRRPVTRPGQLWRDADTLVMEMAEPRWEQRRLSPTRATLIRTKPTTRPGSPKTQRLSLKLDEDKPAHVLLIALRAALMGDSSALHQRMRVSARVLDPDSDKGWLVTLSPLADVKGLCGLTLRGDGSGSDSQLTRVDVDQCGSWQRIDVTTPSDDNEPAQ